MRECALLAVLFVSACSAPGPNLGPGSIRLKHPTDTVEFWADPADEPTISVDGRRPTQFPSWPDFVPPFTKVVSAKWTPDARSIEVTFADGQQAILSFDWKKVEEAQRSSKKHYYLAPEWREPGGKMPDQKTSIGDNVRVRDTAVTRAAGVAGLMGPVFGETKPSVTGVNVIGELTGDYAINVHLEERGKALWFAPELLEFVDHGAGTEIRIDGVDRKWTRTASGEWKESPLGEGPRTQADPNETSADQQTLNQLRKAGSDLTRPHEVAFYLYIPKKADADAAAAVLRSKGYSVTVRLGADEVNWLCIANRTMVPEIDQFRKARELIEGLATRYRGEYDGWESSIEK